jgi:hypothetical protein
MTVLPARDPAVVDLAVGDEVVVFDPRSEQAHALDGLRATLWPLCDGTVTAAAAAGQLDVAVEQIEQAVAELVAANLLSVSGYTRRQLLRRGVLVTGAAAAVPIMSVLIRPIAAAASGTGGGGGGPATLAVTLSCHVFGPGITFIDGLHFTGQNLSPNQTNLTLTVTPTVGTTSGLVTDANGNFSTDVSTEVPAVGSFNATLKDVNNTVLATLNFAGSC